MKRSFLIISLFFGFYIKMFSMPDFYLITIAEEKEPYAMYGHTALRICDTATAMDFIVDWGIFDFDQPNFYLNFAKGKMIYTTGTHSFQQFLANHSYLNKGAVMRKIALNDRQKERLWNYISWMLEPEQRDYRYRFLYDNCATRPRDLLEATLQQELLYPANPKLTFTYRDMLHHYQQVNLWYNLLIDIILGANVDKIADFREQMFIPEYLEKNLSETFVLDSINSHPLLEAQTTLIETIPLSKTPKMLAPEIIFLFIFFIVLILDYLQKGRKILRVFDFVFFGMLIFFGLLIMFLWIVSEHQEAHNNFNLIWLNPLYVFTLIALVKKKKNTWLYISICYIVIFCLLALLQLFPQSFPTSMYIILVIVLERCMVTILKTKIGESLHGSLIFRQ